MDRSKELKVLGFCCSAEREFGLQFRLDPTKKKQTNKQQSRLLYSNVWTVERLRVRFDDWCASVRSGYTEEPSYWSTIKLPVQDVPAGIKGRGIGIPPWIDTLNQ